jgi:hypothetical protein
MPIQKRWPVKLGGKHRRIRLFHNLEDGSGVIYYDGSARQLFGPRVAPTSSTFTFNTDPFADDNRSCTVKIELTDTGAYRYECEIDGVALMADYERSAPAATLLRASEAPIPSGGELMRPAGAAVTLPAGDLVIPASTSGERDRD